MSINRSFSEKVYLLMLLISNIISGIYLLVMGKYDIWSILGCSCILVIGYIYSLKLFDFINRDTYQRKRVHFEVNKRRFNIFILVYLIIMIIYSFRTGDGAAEIGNLHSSSIFASLWVPDSIFLFYFCFNREEHKIFVRINSVVFILHKILLGWSGQILIIALFELYYLYRDRKANFLKVGVIIIAAFLGGGVLYSYLYPLKYSIRYGLPFSLSNHLAIGDAINKLAVRLARLDVSLFVDNNYDTIIKLYRNQGVELAEFVSIFRPIVPSALMKNKIFSSLGSCIYNAQSGYRGMNITNNCGIMYYYRLLAQADILSFFLCIFMFIIMFWLLKKVYNAFQTEPGQFRFLFFWIFMAYASCGTLENLIANSYIKILFFIPLLFVFKIIRIMILPQQRSKMCSLERTDT